MEGAPHTAKRRLGLPSGCPLPKYIKEVGREAGPLGARQEYGVLLGVTALELFADSCISEHHASC